MPVQCAYGAYTTPVRRPCESKPYVRGEVYTLMSVVCPVRCPYVRCPCQILRYTYHPGKKKKKKKKKKSGRRGWTPRARNQGDPHISRTAAPGGGTPPLFVPFLGGGYLAAFGA
eukprot:FR738559.1.p5 GENE.FR738559.1~~FR738559.1.p5  ORF type:complete len:114 (+),score=35.35 FR738559.1:741-1082(+)